MDINLANKLIELELDDYTSEKVVASYSVSNTIKDLVEAAVRLEYHIVNVGVDFVETEYGTVRVTLV